MKNEASVCKREKKANGLMHDINVAMEVKPSIRVMMRNKGMCHASECRTERERGKEEKRKGKKRHHR